LHTLFLKEKARKDVYLKIYKIEHDFRKSTKSEENIEGFPEFNMFFNFHLMLYNPGFRAKKVNSIKLYILGRKRKYILGQKQFIKLESFSKRKLILSYALPSSLSLRLFRNWEKCKGIYPLGQDNFYYRSMPKTFNLLLEFLEVGMKVKREEFTIKL